MNSKMAGMNIFRELYLCIAVLMVALCTGCISLIGPDPSFSVTIDEAKADLREIREVPLPLERPLVISGGYLDPGTATDRVIRRFEKLTTTPDLVIGTPYFSVGTMETARRRLVEKVEARFPSDDPEWTTQVDLVGISMGGLVARYAQMDNGGAHKRLRINRLFTLSTPHRGAAVAWLPSIDKKQIAMRRGSAFIELMEETAADIEYEMLTYVRLGDGIVGTHNASPLGMPVRWIPNEAFGFSHLGVQNDPRLTLEIIRRLRGEEPPSGGEPSPLPQ